jgi:DNA-damage-inducible protein D
MNARQLPSPPGGASFESLRKTNEFGAEYWSARELQSVLGYTNWRTFETAVQRAITSCETSGNHAPHHFEATLKMIPVGKGGKRSVPDFQLSRFACYLIAQNGDPQKPEIALAQKYFVVQARRQELSDELAKDKERLELRNQAKEEFKQLSGVARKAGVSNPMFGIFHDAGYRGLYGMGRDAIRKHKRLPDGENLMDRMDTTELAANQFRMTQTRDKLAREKIQDEQDAIRTHESVGREVRKAIAQIGGTMPEETPPAEPIERVEQRVKASHPRLELDGEDAKGLLGDDQPGAGPTPRTPKA